jgi:hypothetical protein
MEFSYRITEAEYLHASKLKPLRSFLSKAFRGVKWMILFWVSVFVGLVLLWVVVERSGPPRPAAPHTAATGAPRGSLLKGVLVAFGPFLLIGGGGSIYLMFGLEPMLTRRNYRSSARMQGQFTASITPGSISVRDFAGASTQEDGDVYEWWNDDQGLILLGLRSKACSIVSLAGLSEADRVDLRRILAATLTRR